jgi:hypothetical protein
MPLAILAAALILASQYFVERLWGPMGAIALLLLSIGVKARNTTAGGIGAAILVMLLAQHA